MITRAQLATLIGIKFTFEAELLAVTFTINKAIYFQLSPIWIEMNSMFIVKLL